VQTDQSRIANRTHEPLGPSDTAINLSRKILARELRAKAESRPLEKWTTPPTGVVPSLGF